LYAERVKATNGGVLPSSSKLLLEVYIPSFSVCALLGVTTYISVVAIDVVRHSQGQDNVNIFFLFAFASGNFFVDIVSSYMFYWRGGEVLLANPIRQMSKEIEEQVTRPNLNMISALTHVGSDTLRTTSVFVAAVVSFACHQDPSLCDAWAAIAVSLTIVFAVVPLITEIKRHFIENSVNTPLIDHHNLSSA
jgi:Co/Zn/Cd efflux system component